MPYSRNFNGGRFGKGGRFYCEAQNIPKGFRPHILIDGGPTVELDYLANHVFMLYGDLGMQLSSDPYLDVTLAGFQDAKLLRKAVKRALLVMINAKNRPKAIKALRRVELQYRDSQVAARIFRRFVAAGMPIFGLHDGFRVRAEDEDFLRAAMLDGFKAEVGVNPIVEP
jgi:hypothetical protein